MGLLDWLFGGDDSKKKRVFISFAVEDMQYRDYLIQQAKNKHSPFEFIDMSVKIKWNEKEWKKNCRTKIKRSHGVIALLSKNTHHAGGARWEMTCAKEEGVKIIGMHIQKNNKGAIPQELKGKKVIEWSWENLEKFIESL
jgi:hypothetical protein